ncbi:MAG: hypothetical protein ACK4SA_02940, partial [Caldilinea sp.]
MSLHPTILALPVAIPLVFGALGILIQSMPLARRLQIQKVLVGSAICANLVVAVILLAFALTGGPIAYQMGLWVAPFGITVYLDAMTGIMLTMVGLLSLLIYPFALATIDAERAQLGFFPMTLF